MRVPLGYLRLFDNQASRCCSPDDQILVSLERRMKCGVGKCGHCQINDVYVCQEGPVFNYARIKQLKEAI